MGTEQLKNIEEWEVLTPSGWQSFSGVKKTEVSGFVEIIYRLPDGSIEFIKCSKGHQILVNRDGEIGFIFAECIDLNDELIFEDEKSVCSILSINVNHDTPNDMYDLINVNGGYRYNTHGIISHNCAHIEGIDDLWLALSPSLSTGGRAILISTPNGVGNLFHRIWTGAQEGTNGFKPIEIPWYKHPQRDQEWYDIQAKAIRAAKGERGVAQELECNFNASGDTFLPPEHMDVLFSRVTDPPWKHPVYPECWVWKQPNPNHRYVIGADVSRGDAEDFSAFCVVDIDDDEVVADYKAKIQSDKLADVLIEIGKYYNTALICPELNSYGLLTSDALKKSGYPNLYYDKLRKNVYQVMTQSEMTNSDELPGIQMHVKNREEILAKFETILRNGHIITHSKRLYEELKTFMWRNNKAQAQKGYNDDIIMAYAMTFSLFEASGRNLYSDEDMAMGLLAGMSTNTNTLVPFGQGFNPSDSIALPIFTNSSLARQNKFLEKKRQFELQSKINPSFESNRIANNPQHPLSPLWGEFAWVAKD